MPKRRLRHEVNGYSLVFTFGTMNFALHSTQHVGRQVFFTRYRDALAFRRELKAHNMETRVVKVKAILEEQG